MPVYLNLINSSFGGASSHKDHKDFAFKFQPTYGRTEAKGSTLPSLLAFHLSPLLPHPLIP